MRWSASVWGLCHSNKPPLGKGTTVMSQILTIELRDIAREYANIYLTL